jgi:hypothetical protein
MQRVSLPDTTDTLQCHAATQFDMLQGSDQVATQRTTLQCSTMCLQRRSCGTSGTRPCRPCACRSSCSSILLANPRHTRRRSLPSSLLRKPRRLKVSCSTTCFATCCVLLQHRVAMLCCSALHRVATCCRCVARRNGLGCEQPSPRRDRLATIQPWREGPARLCNGRPHCATDGRIV